MGQSLGRRRRVVVRVVVPSAPATAYAMPRPAFHSGPTYGNEQHDDRERNSHASDIEDVAERVVWRRLVERTRLLDNSDEHHTSGGAPERTCWCERSESISNQLVTWLTRCGVIRG
jgi:hypothetical protein